MTKFTNYTKGPKGVHTKAGLVYVDAGQSADLDVSDEEAKAARATGWFSKSAAEAEEPVADPLDHDANGKKGGAAAPKAS